MDPSSASREGERSERDSHAIARKSPIPLPRTQHPRRDYPPDQLLAGEQAVSPLTPIPDDELLTTELARLDRKIGAADTEQRRLIDLCQGGFIELPEVPRHRSRLPPKRAAAQEKQPRRRTNRARS